ncbi:hypothetical protein KY345_06000 [Candidatus Woesearchaeota archaeon]|nr:hypothetical protein [Candidatus Woesearchaeota archaeon]
MARKKTVKKVHKKKAKKAAGYRHEIKVVKKSGKPAKVVLKKQALGQAPEEKVFYLKDGKKLRNILELTEAFETMSEDVFRHHVNEMRNDFSNWVSDVLEDKELAEDIKDIRDRTDAEIRLLKHMVKKLTSAV